jgi:hypothetical protein
MKAAQFFASAAIGIVLVAPAALARTAANPPAPSSAAPQKGAQQSVPIDHLPAAVTAAVEKAYPKSTIVNAAKVSRGTQVRYELSVKPNQAAQPIAVMASAEGVIRAAGAGRGQRKTPATVPAPQGETVAVNQLPKAVVQAIKEAYPKDSIVDAIRTASGSKILYELILSDVSSVQPMHVVVSSDGKIQKR